MAPTQALHSTLLATIGLTAALSLTSCAVAGPSDATITATVTITATPAPSEPPSATCRDVLTTAGYAEMVDMGWIRFDGGSSAFVPDVFGEERVLVCVWAKPTTDGTDGGGFRYAQRRLPMEEWADHEAALKDDGYSPEDDPRGELLVGPTSDLGLIPAVVYDEGVLHYVSDVVYLDWVDALNH